MVVGARVVGPAGSVCSLAAAAGQLAESFPHVQVALCWQAIRKAVGRRGQRMLTAPSLPEALGALGAVSAEDAAGWPEGLREEVAALVRPQPQLPTVA